MSGETTRCGWVNQDPIFIAYHDEEWGVPSHDDRHLFEMIILEGAQAGLSWSTILKKRSNYRQAFHNFNAEKVARIRPAGIETLLSNPGIVRNRAKITATVLNAKAILAIREEFGTLDRFVWSFVDDKPIQNQRESYKDAPSYTMVSNALSKALLARGCKFVGSTIMYAFMQAVGMVNDHEVTCHCYNRLASRK